MKMIDIYREHKSKNNKFVILIKVGNFYEVYGEEAYILNNLFNYKIKDCGEYIRVGFPTIAYNKVINKLNAFKINYLIIDGNNIQKKRFNKNRYYEYLTQDLSIENRIYSINEKLNVLKNSSKINSILKQIEDIL